ncbi:ABC transporter ATP-binding protein [Desulfovibrio sp. OttesenSCG-928-G15]|nr:ABC transporter ATP-binding protein [Desulfovibrio sp. OttesenSCG-928-G15]
MSSIAVENLAFAYDSEVVLKDINLRIESGDFACLLGESGCGKSTFLRLMAGLAMPTAGVIKVDGKPVNGAGLDRGVVFQDYSLFPWLTNGYNLLLALRQKYKDKSKKELKEMALRGLEEVGLDASVFHKFPFELSGGMRQRCAICRAFTLDPPVLLMDEPFGALDAITRARLQRTILHLWRKNAVERKTIVFVTHDVDEALLLANKIFLFGSSPSGIIYQHFFKEGEKPPADELLDSPHIIQLRNRLIQALNKDIATKVEHDTSAMLHRA